MDSDRFDALARTLSSRRTALGGLLGGSLAALLGLTGGEEAAAHNYLASCRKIKDGPRRRRCLRRARAHNRSHQPPPCVAQSPAVVCASVGRCDGVAVDNCGKLINCSCPPGKGCLGNGSCAQACAGETCPAGCGCSVTNVEGQRHCISIVASCAQLPQGCSSTTECPVGQQCQLTGCGGPNPIRCAPLCPR